jgi:uncharacterized protein (TIGR03437 family)
MHHNAVSLPDYVTRVCTVALFLTCNAGAAYASLPITFEENRGQVAGEALFIARTPGYRLFLTRRGAEVGIQDGHAVRISLAGSRDTTPVGIRRLVTKTNYLIGADPAGWRTGIANYAEVRYARIYPGIDMSWHARGSDIEHDFLVAAGADPRQIRLVLSGAALRITAEGDLAAGTLRFHKPRAFQEGREVACRYELRGRNVRFALGPYDGSRPLTIDPVLSFSTYLGGTAPGSTTTPPTTTPVATALDGAGNLYVGGGTSSLDFPVTAGALQPRGTGGVCSMHFAGVPVGVLFTDPCSDLFVAKFSGDGSTLLYATYLGGPGNNSFIAMAVGAAGNVYIAGRSTVAQGSTSTTPGFPNLVALPGQTLAANTSFVTELSANGSSMVYATALPVDPVAVAVDASGALYITGTTKGGLPTVNGFQPALANPALSKTTDAGNHWQSLANGVPGGYVIAADPTNPLVLYVGSSSHLYKTSDGGMSWNSVFDSGDPKNGVFSAAIDPKSPQNLYIGVANQPTVYKSGDGGATWTSGTGLGYAPLCVTIDPKTPSVLYAGTLYGIYRSADGGGTWQPTGLFGISGVKSYQVTRVVIDPTQTATIYAATQDGIMKSIDGGATWNLMNNGIPQPAYSQFFDVEALAIDSTAPQTLYTAMLENPGVFKTTDGGAHWTQTALPANTGYVNSLLVDPQNHTRIWAATSGGGVVVSPDSGTTWALTALPHFATISLAADAAGAIYTAGAVPPSDAFAMKLDPTGANIVYSTFVGGTGDEIAGGIAVDASGRAYIAGETDSRDFPVASPLQAQLTGTSDVFVTVVDPTGSHLVWSTYLGGSGSEGATAIALDAAGNVHVAGVVSQRNTFPAIGPVSGPADVTADAFVAKLKGDGSATIFSTHLGGNSYDTARSVAADAAGNTYVAGFTYSADLPTVNAVQPTLAGNINALVAEFDGRTGAVGYATYLGGTKSDYGIGIATDASGNAYVAGTTGSPDFPLKNPWQSSVSTGFVAKLGPPLRMNNVTNAASYTPAVTPGELVSIFGAALASSTASATQLPLPTQLSDAQVIVNGIAVPLLYASPQQLNAQIRFETAPGAAQVQVSSAAGTSTMTVQVTATAPAIFTLNQQGTGPGAILHGQTYQVVSGSSPAAAGEIISIYCTGLGAVNPPAQTGGVPPDPPPQVVDPVQVSIGGLPAPVLYAGVAPGYAGLYQINAQIPIGTPSGPQPLQIIQNGAASNTVTVTVQ